jgi:protein arginine kinase activator
LNCDECKKRPAAVHFTQVYNGKMVETHLCQQCYVQKGGIIFDVAKQLSLPNLLGSFFVSNYNLQDMKSLSSTTACPNCGMKLGDISNTGRLGCSRCYTAFERELEPTLRRVHGDSRHVGKIPARGGEKVMVKKKIEGLKYQLQKAIAVEDYEKAAEIRDEIKETEKQLD